MPVAKRHEVNLPFADGSFEGGNRDDPGGFHVWRKRIDCAVTHANASNLVRRHKGVDRFSMDWRPALDIHGAPTSSTPSAILMGAAVSMTCTCTGFRSMKVLERYTEAAFKVSWFPGRMNTGTETSLSASIARATVFRSTRLDSKASPHTSMNWQF
jgi:hypothetical protein